MLELDEDVRTLIAEYGLHEGMLPVNLAPLETRFVPRPTDLTGSGVVAYAVPPKHGMPTDTDPAFVVLADWLSGVDRRIVYAHEVAHVLLGHVGSLRCVRVNGWFHDKQEREAWRLAARLLVPFACFADPDGPTPDEIAARCFVPRWLVELYPR